jgi:hypothetical protein
MSKTTPDNPAVTHPWRTLRPLRRLPLIWQMIGLALLLHLVFLLGFSPNLFSTSADSPEGLYERGETELAQGHYDEAMALFQKVMDLQPKIPPVFEKAADQHKAAERLARQAGTQPAASANGEPPQPTTLTTGNGPATAPAVTPKPPVSSTRPATAPYVPPELGGK